MSAHRWDEIRGCQVTLDGDFATRAVEQGTRGFHESLFRSYAILSEVKAMLDRDDSPATIRAFIRWAEGRDDHGN